MNRSELIGDLVSELVRTLPDKDKDLDADDLETVGQTVTIVLDMAEKAIDEENNEDEDEGSSKG